MARVYATMIVDHQAVSNKIKRMRRTVRDFFRIYLQKASETVVLASPVDTGTYMTSHRIRVGRDYTTDFTTSYDRWTGKKKPKMPWDAAANIGLSNLFNDIEALPEDADNVTITNIALHADAVEYVHGYAPYGTMKRNAEVDAEAAEAEAKARNL